MRPASARLILARPEEDDPGPGRRWPKPSRLPPLDRDSIPAWALARAREARAGPIEPAGRGREGIFGGPPRPSIRPRGRGFGRSALEALGRRGIREPGGWPARRTSATPRTSLRAGMLHALGLWAVASIAPELLVEWFALARPDRPPGLGAGRWLGMEASGLGREAREPLGVRAAGRRGRLAPRRPLAGDLSECAEDPSAVSPVIQSGLSPWPSGPPGPRAPRSAREARARRPPGQDPHRRGPVAMPRRVRRPRRLAPRGTPEPGQRPAPPGCSPESALEEASRERFVRAVTESSPDESPEAWADRAGLALCGEPGCGLGPGRLGGFSGAVLRSHPGPSRSPWIRLGTDPRRSPPSSGDDPPPRGHPTISGRIPDPGGLGRLGPDRRAVDERIGLCQRLDAVLAEHRGPGRPRGAPSVGQGDARIPIAEFAAGAGHELNNPLAVILGRAQLLMARQADPDAVRSLKAIIAQAQRAHRILRDLMYVRPPPRAPTHAPASPRRSSAPASATSRT